MARPIKNNADYFSHDADMRNDVKIRALRRKYGAQGYSVWCYLLEVFTDTDFFEFEWSEINIELLSADFDVTPDELTEIVQYCVDKLDLLQLENGKLFCNNLKKRLSSVVEKRRKRQINGMLGGNPNFVKGQPNPYYQKDDNAEQNITNTYESITETLPKHNQSKVKENKGNKSITNEKYYSNTPRLLEELFPILNNDEQWLNDVCYGKGKLGSTLEVRLKQVNVYLNRFYETLKGDGVKEKSISDAKFHFNRWLNLELKKT